MASKVSALIEATTIAATDLFYSVVGGASRRVKAENVFATFTGSKHLFSYATLNAAVDAIASAQATLWITSSTTVAASKTVPSNITLKLTGTGVISVNASQTLTINGPIEAPLRQIFTGSGVVRIGAHIPIVYPQWWGAVLDGSTNDQAAIQKAIDSFTSSGAGVFRAGIVELTGGAVINSTLTIAQSGVVLRGTGWGIQADPLKRGFIKWEGSAGDPMILIVDVVASGVENIRLIGKTSAKPSAAIEIRQTGGAGVQDQATLKNIYIGAYFSTDTDTGVQFTTGILFTGSVNSDFNTGDNIVIQRCVTGIDVQNPNASVTHWSSLTISECDVGFKTVALHTGRKWLFALNLVDLSLGGNNGKLSIDHFASEGSGRLAVLTAGRADLHIRSGSFQCYLARFTPADSGNNRWLIDAGLDNGGTSIRLEDFEVSYEAGVTIVPVIRQKALTGGIGAVSDLRLINMVGITAKNLDVGSAAGYSDTARYIEFSRRATNIAVTPINSRVFLNFASPGSNAAFQDTRFDVLGKLNSYGGPFNVERLPTPGATQATATGGTGTLYGYRISALSLDGETLATATFTCSGGAVLSPTVYNTIIWYPIVGAYAYNIYGRTSGSELLMATILASDIGDTFAGGYVDDGSDTPSGALPIRNSTGNAKVYGIFSGGKGEDVASAATIVPTGNVFHVTGTTTITSVSGTGIAAGTEITIIFDGILTFTDGSNLKLAGNFVTSADDSITLVYDGTSWFEKCRSVN